MLKNTLSPWIAVVLLGGGVAVGSTMVSLSATEGHQSTAKVLQGPRGAGGLRPPAAQQEPEFDVPEGFEVEQLLSHEEVGSVVAMTFDAEGRMVLAKEFGEIVTLFPGQNGTYEQRVFTEEVTNSQGILFDGPDLLATAVGPEGTGLYRVVDEDGDARGDRVELIESANRRIEDHGPHTTVWGPDGFLYWLHANTSGIYADESPLSPVRSFDDASLLHRTQGFYRLPAGKILRKDVSRFAGPPATTAAAATPDWELFAVGLRNPYDLSFNLAGELFLYDSDHERDLAMPWYREVRTLHILPGGQYGYREGSGVHPIYYFDDGPTLENLQRGSPTGVVAYQAYSYPAEYWDMVFFADWSRGRVLGSRLTKDGATYTPETSNFVFGTPLNVTDVDVGPDGNMYFTRGGRYTQGGVYRVVYGGTDAMTQPEADMPIEQALTMIQPRSAFSRKQAREIKEQLGESAWQQQLTTVARDAQQLPERRMRSLELLQAFGPPPDEALLAALSQDPSSAVRAAAVYYLGMQTTESAQRQLAASLKDADPFVQRRAAEALIRTGISPASSPPVSAVEDVFPLLASTDRALRYAARTLLRELNPNTWREEAFRLTEYPKAVEALLAYVQTIHNVDMYNFARLVNRQLELLRATPTDAQLLDLVRLMQYTMSKDQGVTSFPVFDSSSRVKGGVIYMPGRGFFIHDDVGPPPDGGPSAMGGGFGENTAYAEIGSLLLERFPTGDWRLDREITRVLAYLQAPGAIEKMTAELDKPANDSRQQIHFIDMLSQFEDGWQDESVETVIAWFERAARDRIAGSQVTAMRNDFLSGLSDSQAEVASARIQAAQPQVASLPGGPGGPGGGAGQPMTQEQIESLIFDPQSAMGGNPAAGLVAYQKAACAVCHTFGPVGNQFGPDLTTIAQRFNREDLVRSIVDPSELVADQFAGVTVTRTNGDEVSGLLLEQTPQALTLLSAGGAEISIPVAEIASQRRAEESLMPAGLLDGLTRDERRDLLALLLAGPSALPDTARGRIDAR